MTAAWEEREDHRGTGDLQPAIQREQQDWILDVIRHYKLGFTPHHRRDQTTTTVSTTTPTKLNIKYLI